MDPTLSWSYVATKSFGQPIDLNSDGATDLVLQLAPGGIMDKAYSFNTQNGTYEFITIYCAGGNFTSAWIQAQRVSLNSFDWSIDYQNDVYPQFAEESLVYIRNKSTGKMFEFVVDVISATSFTIYSNEISVQFNSAPTITSVGTTSTPENVSTSTAIYTVAASDPDPNTTLNYSISGGVDASIFNINTVTGAVTFKSPPDYEAPKDLGGNNVYDIILRASDGSLYTDKAVAITVTDVNETLIAAQYNWSALTNNQSIAFNPSTDKLTFDNSGISAASVIVVYTAAGTIMTAAGKSVTLQSDVSAFTTTNFSFADGSRLVFANNGASASGGSGNDQLIGVGNFDNYFQGSAGNNVYDGGPNGQFGDRIDYSASPSGVTVNLETGTAQNGYGGIDQLKNVEHVSGSAFADNLTGDASTNWFNPGAGNDTVNGGSGKDVVMYEEATAGVNVNLLTGTATGASIGTDILISIEAVHGSRNYDDIIQLTNDGGYAFGRGGNDQINGGTGNDYLIGGSGNDTLNGGDGFDTADYKADAYDPAGIPTRGIVANLVTGIVTDNWGGTDQLVSVEAINGSSMDDVIIGNSWNNELSGGDGNDQITGGAGNDNIDGGNGNDIAVYSALKNNYSLLSLGSGAYIITDLRSGSPDGTDTLVGIETLKFSDVSTDLRWAQPIVTSGVNLTIDTSINGVAAFGAADIGDFTGNGDTKYFKFTSYDSVTGTFNLEVVNEFMPNPNYMTGAAGLFGQAYLAEHDYITGYITAGSPSLPAVNQVLTPNQFNTFFNSASGHVFLTTLTERIDASNDGVNSNAQSYSFLTLKSAGLDARVMTLGSASAGAIFSSNDTITGNSGNDLLNGYAGNDTIYGGAGADTVLYSGTRSQYVLTQKLDGTYLVQDTVADRDGTDTLSNIEYAKFLDQTVSLAYTSSISGIHGIDYFWKADANGKHALLGGVALNATGGTLPVEGANAPVQFKNITWDATGHATVDVYAHVTTAVDSIQINLGLGNATNTAFTSTLSADWTLLGNTSGGEYIIGGYSMTALATGDVKLGTLTFDTGAASQMRLAVDTGSALSSSVQGTINATPYGYTLAHATTGADGAYNMSPLDAGTYALTATRSTSDIGTAITSADALAALKIAVAMNPNPGTGSAQLAVSPFQIMAADANQDGKVTSADALAILKMAVHMTNAVTPEWMFVEETRDLSGITRTTAAWDHNISANVQGDTTVNLAGFIKGDVNGSWTPPTGTQYVETSDPSHFTGLYNTLHIPMSEWGLL